MGLRSSLPLAQFLGYYLSFILDNVNVVTSGVNDILEQLLHIVWEDVLIGISFPRYSRRTLEGVQFAKEKNARIIAITDSYLFPILTYSDHLLIARSDIASFVDSLVAPLSDINALIVSIGIRKKEEVSGYFMQLEKYGRTITCYLEKERLDERSAVVVVGGGPRRNGCGDRGRPGWTVP